VNALRALGAAEDAVTPAAGMQAMAMECARVASAVAAAQAARPMPVAAPKQNYARALRQYATSAADCQAGASTGSAAPLAGIHEDDRKRQPSPRPGQRRATRLTTNSSRRPADDYLFQSMK